MTGRQMQRRRQIDTEAIKGTRTDRKTLIAPVTDAVTSIGTVTDK